MPVASFSVQAVARLGVRPLWKTHKKGRQQEGLQAALLPSSQKQLQAKNKNFGGGDFGLSLCWPTKAKTKENLCDSAFVPPGLDKKRVREEAREEQQDYKETEQPEPKPKMTLEELVQYSITANENNFKGVRQDISRVERATSDARAMAAKATTIAQETKTKLVSLESRVAALEKGSSPLAQGRSGNHPQNQRTSASRDWDQLGGEGGNTLIVGGFRNWASRDERKEDFEKLRAELPADMSAPISEVIIPASPGRIVIVKLQPQPEGPKETRVHMLAWCRRFKEQNLTGQHEGETEARMYYATPSKPYDMRQRDTRTMNMLAGLKALAPTLDVTKFRTDLANGRVFYERTLLAERNQPDDPPSPRMNNIREHIPGITKEDIVNSVAKIVDDREKARKGQ